jgi:hypothetical protein
MFILSGIKEMRFMNLLTPIIAFNIAKISHVSSKKHPWFISKQAGIFFILFFVFVLVAPKPYFVSSFEIPSDSFIKDCRVASDKWVFFYNQNIVAECSYDLNSFKEYVANGGNIVLYDYKNINLDGFNVINRRDYVILKSDSCAPQPKKYISGSLRNYVVKWLRDTNSTVYDYSDWVD